MTHRMAAGLLAACLVTRAGAADATAAERTAFRVWTETVFGFPSRGAAKEAVPRLLAEPHLPFSFGIDGVAFSPGNGKAWRASARSKTLAKGTVERTIRWVQSKTGLHVVCRVRRYADFPAAEWRLEFENRGSQDSPLVDNVRVLDLESLPVSGPASLLHARGDDATVDSFAPVTDELAEQGAQVRMGPDTGRSSDRDLPFFDLTTPTDGLLIGVGWSGSWSGSVERKQGRIRLTAGMRATRFRLKPGERVRMPAILALYHRGAEKSRGANLLRSLLLAHYLPRQDGRLVMPPVCATVSKVDPDGRYEGPHLRPLPAIAQWGFEALWSDMDPQHWYPGEFPGGTGNWRPDPAKYPRGLAPIGQAAHANGLEYLLWFEPERAAPGSDLFVEHPDWLMKGPWAGGHAMVRMQDPEVRRGMLATIGRRLVEGGVDWARFDMNIERPASFWAAQDAPDRIGLTEARYVEGWYAFLDDLAKAYPKLKLDLCSAGGHRLDFESLRRGLPLWTSDMHGLGPNPRAMMLHNAGLSRWIPLFGMPAFGREPTPSFRAALTAGNLYVGFSPEDLMASSEEDRKSLAESVRLSKSLRPSFLGDFYELLPHRADADAYAHQFHREGPGSGIVVAFRPGAGGDAIPLDLRGIDRRKDYAVVWHSGKRQARLSGRELAALTLELPAGGSEIVEYSQLP